jgi:hypothetical protein
MEKGYHSDNYDDINYVSQKRNVNNADAMIRNYVSSYLREGLIKGRNKFGYSVSIRIKFPRGKLEVGFRSIKEQYDKELRLNKSRSDSPSSVGLRSTPFEMVQPSPDSAAQSRIENNYSPADSGTEFQNSGVHFNNTKPSNSRGPISSLLAAERRIIDHGTLSAQKIIAATSDNAEVLNRLAHKALEGRYFSKFVKGSLLYTLLDNENLGADSLDYIARNAKRKKTMLEVAKHQNVSQVTLEYLVEVSRREVMRIAVSSPITSDMVKAQHSVAESLTVMAEAVKHLYDPNAIDLAVRSAAEGSIWRKLNTWVVGVGPSQNRLMRNAIRNSNTSDATLEWIQNITAPTSISLPIEAREELSRRHPRVVH